MRCTNTEMTPSLPIYSTYTDTTGSLVNCRNAATIAESLLAIASKMFANVLLQRLLVVTNVLLETQCGFRSSRSTINTVFTLRQTAFFVVFFSKAFDSISRRCLWRLLSKFGCPDKFMLMLRVFHEGMQAQVMIDGDMTDGFPAAHGVKQGCLLAPTLFTLFLVAMLEVSNCDTTKGVYITTRSSGRFFNVFYLKCTTLLRSGTSIH